MRLMSKTWRFVGNHHTRSLAGPDQAPRPREEVAVAGPPFVVIIMALTDAPPLRALREAISTDPQSKPRKTRRQVST